MRDFSSYICQQALPCAETGVLARLHLDVISHKVVVTDLLFTQVMHEEHILLLHSPCGDHDYYTQDAALCGVAMFIAPRMLYYMVWP